MQADAGMPIAEIRVDGGAVENNLLMQFQADLMGAPVIRPKVTELTALGAAFLAGIAIGFWKNKEEAAASWQKDKTFTPTMPAEKVQILCRKWEKAIDCAQSWEQS